MGNMADFYNAQYENSDEYWYYGFTAKPKKIVECKHCKSTNVYWHQHKNGSWCLFDLDTKQGHVCKEPPDKAINLKKQIDQKREELHILIGQLQRECDHPRKYHVKEEINDYESWYTHIKRCSFCGKVI